MFKLHDYVRGKWANECAVCGSPWWADEHRPVHPTPDIQCDQCMDCGIISGEEDVSTFGSGETMTIGYMIPCEACEAGESMREFLE